MDVRRLSNVVLRACVTAMLLGPATGCGPAKKPAASIAERLAKARGLPAAEGRVRELARIARAQAAAGDRRGAARTLSEARDAVPPDGQPLAFAPRLVDIAEGFAAIDSRPAARATLETAVRLASRIQDPLGRADVLARAATVYASRDDGLRDATAAKATLAEAEAAAGEVPARFQPQALAAVALGQAAAGFTAEARRVVEALEAAVKPLEDLRAKAEALAAAARVRAAVGDHSAAVALLADAAATARGIDAAANRAYALVAVAKAALDADDADEARALLRDAERTTAQIGDPEQARDALQRARALAKALD